jgi:hypothetical protein
LGPQQSGAARVRSNIVKHETSADGRNQDARAPDALQEAREMPRGAQRTEALKKLACFVIR